MSANDAEPTPPATVLAAVSDIFFLARILETGRTLGVPIVACAPGELPERARELKPARAVIDLQTPGATDAVRALRADPATHDLHVIGFFSHVDVATREAAESAGVTQILPRSAFTIRLAELLRG